MITDNRDEVGRRQALEPQDLGRPQQRELALLRDGRRDPTVRRAPTLAANVG